MKSILVVMLTFVTVAFAGISYVSTGGNCVTMQVIQCPDTCPGDCIVYLGTCQSRCRDQPAPAY